MSWSHGHGWLAAILPAIIIALIAAVAGGLGVGRAAAVSLPPCGGFVGAATAGTATANSAATTTNDVPFIPGSLVNAPGPTSVSTHQGASG